MNKNVKINKSMKVITDPDLVGLMPTSGSRNPSMEVHRSTAYL